MAKAKSPQPLGLSHLRVTLSDSFYMGPGRADLLEQIAMNGSISEAAKRMGMSYKRAWSLVQTMNESCSGALVDTSRGGSGQGGASLSAVGQAVLAGYRAMQTRTADAIAAEIATLHDLLDTAGQK